MAKKNTPNIQPLGDRVLIKPAEDQGEQKTDAGIIIPETASEEKPQQGEVVAVGEGKYVDGELVKPQVKVGDTVVFSKFGYDEVKADGEEYYIVKGDNLLAIIS